MRSVVVSGVLSIAVAIHSAAADPPKKPAHPIKLPKGMKVPPDIQAIIDKQSRGETLTMDDIQKLQAWAMGVQNNLPVNGPVNPMDPSKPANPDEKQGLTVPARVDLSAHYTSKSGGTVNTFTISETTNLDLIAKINGTDDYATNVLVPGAHVSSFLFQGNESRGTGQYHFHQDASGSTDLVATLSLVTGGFMFVTMGGDTLGIIPGQINGKVTGKYHSLSRDGKAHDEPYDDAMRESLVELLFPWEAHTTKDRTKPNPKPRAQISYKQLVDAIQSGKTTPIKVTEHFDWNDHGEQVVGDVDVTITLRPTKTPQLEARIEPVSDWDNWIPEGPLPKREHGNTFSAHIVLYDATSGQPWKGEAKVESVDYELKDVSHLPGVCTNWPKPGHDGYEKKPDLFFAESNKHGKVPKTDRDRQTLKLDKHEWFETVIVESRDFGGWGQLTAKVKLAGADPVDAKFAPLGTAYLPLPRDDDHNHMSDGYKPSNNVEADADDENTPVLKTKGDGFTAMEEYRGFLLSPGRRVIADGGDEEHRRLDPTKRELIVIIEVDPGRAPLVERGIEIFEQAAQVKVYALATADRTGPHVADNGRPRSIVFNPSPPDGKAADQSLDTVGTWITSAALKPGEAVARAWPVIDNSECDKQIDVCVNNPQSLRYVAIGDGASTEDTINWMISMIDPDDPGRTGGEITHAAAKLVDAYLKKRGVTADQRRAVIKAAEGNMPELIKQMNGFSIAHELGHVLGAQHHGVFLWNADKTKGQDGGADNCPLRYWQALNDHFEDVMGPNPKNPKKQIKIGSKWVGLWTDPANAMEWLDFLRGKWKPLDGGPTGPWTICDENRAQMTFKP